MNEDSVVQQHQQQQQHQDEGAVPPQIAYMDGKAIAAAAAGRSGIMNNLMGCFGFMPFIGKPKPEGLENHQGKTGELKVCLNFSGSTKSA